jgi:hypothetical protein
VKLKVYVLDWISAVAFASCLELLIPRGYIKFQGFCMF